MTLEALNTGKGVVTKGDLKRWLNESNLPDDSEVALLHDDGQFIVSLNWSHLSGAFGEDFIVFDRMDSSEAIRQYYVQRTIEG